MPEIINTKKKNEVSAKKKFPTFEQYLETVRGRVAQEVTSVLAPRLGDDPCRVIAEFVSVENNIPDLERIKKVGGFKFFCFVFLFSLLSGVGIVVDAWGMLLKNHF